MSRGDWARPVHRWTTIVFTVAVIANFVARGLGQGEPAAWITCSPLPPLFLQLFAGLYLFALHYAGQRRSAAAPHWALRAEQGQATASNA